MGAIDTLPPSSHGRLTALAWIAVAGSFLFCLMLFYLEWIYPAMLYAGIVAVGFLSGARGGMHYQGDIDSFLAMHPELSRTGLPWPPDYQLLSGKQKFLYFARGFSQMIAIGFLMPVNFLLAALIGMGILKEDVVETLFRRYDKAA
ncbi:MAG TPA: hypothetical protein VFF26_12220 [Gallionella sp.]|nr:hypothetical protein [Gallionella sp.]